MDDIDIKTCVFCNTENRVDSIHIKNTECKHCNIQRVSKPYYFGKNEIPRKLREKYARFKDLDNRLAALEEKLSISNLKMPN